MRVVFLGLPGSGKGTQARLLCRHLGLPFIGMGDLLRAEINQNTSLGNCLKPILDRGEFPDDNLVMDIFLNNVLKLDGFVAEGIPRSDVQARLLDQAFERSGVTLDFVFYLKLAPHVALERLLKRYVCLSCGATYGPKDGKKAVCDFCGGSELGHRQDDVENVMRKRLQSQQKKDENVLAFYESRSFLQVIDAHLEPTQVEEKILDAIKNQASRGF